MKKKLKNQPKIKKRRNFFPTLVLAILFWAALSWLIYTFAPSNHWLITAFYLLLFIAVFLTVALILANSRRGFLIATGLVCFLIFRYYNLANYLNLILFAGILISLEFFFQKGS